MIQAPYITRTFGTGSTKTISALNITAPAGMVTHCPMCGWYRPTQANRYPVCNDCWYRGC